MKSTITFGKYKDRTPEQLKRIDSDYLRWGAQNLNAPKWRREIQEAHNTLTIDDEAHEMSTRDMIPFWEARNYLLEMQEMQDEEDAEMAAFEKKKKAIIAEWSAESGQTIAKLSSIINSNKFMFGWDWVTPDQFSSHQQYELFCKYMQKISEI